MQQESPLEWFERQKQAGADIEIWWYEEAAHGMFLGPINRQARVWGATDKRFAWTGGSEDARQKFLSNFEAFVQSRSY